MLTEKMKVIPGDPERFGARATECGVNFSIAVPDDLPARLVLTNEEGVSEDEIELPVSERYGEVSSVFVSGLKAQKFGYYYLVGDKKMQDPYAEIVCDGYAKVIPNGYDWKEDRAPQHALDDLVIYKLNVRGFTMKAKGVRHKGTFTGLKEKANYIAELGFNAVEIMPMYEWDSTLKIPPYAKPETDEDGHVKEGSFRNFWGYAAKNQYFAPKNSFAATKYAVREVREMVQAFHKLGIAVVMEMYFPADTVPEMALAAIRHWKTQYHIDGFHLIGEGTPVSSIVRDPLLKRTIVMLDHVDGGWIYGGGVPKYRCLAEYNGGFMNTARALLKGDEGQILQFVQNIRRNPMTNGVVNYVANVNGFTLYDTVSYDWKHNEENGEDNKDGSDFNLSWNCGVEGPTRKKAVRELRMRQMKNLLTYLFLSQGTPLLMAGDEMLNTQNGNNNAYASDNPVGWTDWTNGKEAEELRAFVKTLVAFRKEHKIFHMSKILRGSDYRSLGAPDISFHDTRAWIGSFENASRALGAFYNAYYAGEDHQQEKAFYHVMYNAYWDRHTFALPNLPKDFTYSPVMLTGEGGPAFVAGGEIKKGTKFFEVPARSVTILVGRERKVKDTGRSAKDNEVTA